MPLAAILLLVTMKSIPEDLYKAAKVDGANHVQRFLHVTLPSLRPGFMLVLVYETMIAIRHFDLFFILTEGGPGDASATLSWQIYVETFRSLRFGTGAALAYILALATLVLGYLMIRLLRQRDDMSSAARRPMLPAVGRSVLLLFMASLFVFYVGGPVDWLFTSSFEPEAQIASVPPHWIPQDPTLLNFEAISPPAARSPTRTAGRAIPRPGASSRPAPRICCRPCGTACSSASRSRCSTCWSA